MWFDKSITVRGFLTGKAESVFDEETRTDRQTDRPCTKKQIEGGYGVRGKRQQKKNDKRFCLLEQNEAREMK